MNRKFSHKFEFMNIPELLISRLSILDSQFSTLDSRVSKLERLDLRDARIEFRESSRDCQLTFERYCIYVSSDKLNFYLFADDTNILYANKNLKSLEQIVNQELCNLYIWLTANNLTLNIKKRQIL